MKNFFLILRLVLSLFNQQAYAWNVYLPDNREVIDSEDKLIPGLGSINFNCTGILISENEVLTAAHCVDKLSEEQVFFYPHLIQKPTFQIRVKKIRRLNSSVDATDLAVLELVGNPGKLFGFLPMSFTEPDTISVAGYSYDREQGLSATIHRGCSVRKRLDDGTFLHDCDATRGSSGGPVLAEENGQLTVVGVNIGEYRGHGEESLLDLPEYSDKVANGAVSVKNARDLF